MGLVRCETADNIAVISLERPEKLNALNREILAELDSAIAAAADAPETRVIVLRGSGGSFCAGADVQELANPKPEELEEFLLLLTSVLRRISAAPQPVIAAIQGHAAGGGAEIALETDLRVASQDAQLWYPDVSIGSTPMSVWQLVRIVGRSVAAQMVLLGRRLDAEALLDFGVVHAVAPRDELDEAALSIARRLRDDATRMSLRSGKTAIHLALSASRDADLVANIGSALACDANTRAVLEAHRLLAGDSDANV